MSVELGEITCRELVELVTGYLEGALDPADRDRFEEHLEICAPCVAYVEQIRLTIAASGAIGDEQLDPGARAELLTAFRDWKRDR
jgi:anti-sigma factor RsiW